MNAESKLDDKGRILIPSEIRKLLNIKSGERLLFQIQEDKIILRKSNSIEDLVSKSEEFSKKLKENSKEPIEFQKILD
ncbi:MAG: AbrB/MazE/SpoVT family DNA-binding domain-containing protein [Promethearchaeota archaeon]|nr:MAG: AbrB/MazE/SpoVT family DNA-binding domain-containing protein [Candidatus Lokiarchaeota archaeon]